MNLCHAIGSDFYVWITINEILWSSSRTRPFIPYRQSGASFILSRPRLSLHTALPFKVSRNEFYIYILSRVCEKSEKYVAKLVEQLTGGAAKMATEMAQEAQVTLKRYALPSNVVNTRETFPHHYITGT